VLPSSLESVPMKDDRPRRYDLVPPPPSGEEFKAFRVKWGRTQRQAARICRRNVSTIASWEKDRSKVDLASWLLLQVTCDPKARAEWLKSL
jgi:DNA-binding transcriptional regulator YiaG